MRTTSESDKIPLKQTKIETEIAHFNFKKGTRGDDFEGNTIRRTARSENRCQYNYGIKAHAKRMTCIFSNARESLNAKVEVKKTNYCPLKIV